MSNLVMRRFSSRTAPTGDRIADRHVLYDLAILCVVVDVKNVSQCRCFDCITKHSDRNRRTSLPDGVSNLVMI